VSQQYPPQVIGGAEIIAHLQLKTMQEDGLARSVVLSLDVQRKHMPETVTCETYEGVTVVRVCFPIERLDQRGVCFFHPLVNGVFREMCEIVKPEVVHGHHITGMSLGIIDIAREYGAKVVFTLHDNWGFCYKNTTIDNDGRLCPNAVDCENCREMFDLDEYSIPMGSRKSYYRRQMEKTDAYVSPSEYMARAYIRAGFDPRKIHVIWNGIDAERYAAVKTEQEEKVRITFAGIFGPHKGVEYLIRALGLLKDEPVVLKLAGKGEEEPKYRALAEELGVAEKITFLGKVDNAQMIDIYRETDIFCLPAVSPENQPVTITEAMACGIPVIASRIGGVPELVEDGVTGYLAKPWDAEDLAEKIRMMVKDRKKMRQMGEAGRVRMRENDFHAQAGRLSALYDAIKPGQAPETRDAVYVPGKKIPYGMDKEYMEDVLLAEWDI
jgi:glycosyltransferase involved in cell wall biosynthesis